MRTVNSVPLGELFAPKLGSVDPSKHLGESFDLYSIPAFDRREPETVQGSEIGSSKQIVLPNDVLLSRIVPHIRRAWVVGSPRGRRLIASGEWIVFRSDRFEPRYLRHVLTSDLFHAEFMLTVSGVGGSLLRARSNYVSQIEVPLPPLAEQRRIADILDKADALRAKRRAALAQLDTLTQSIFLDMFGDPISAPRWKTEPLENMLESIDSGWSPRCLDRPVARGEWGVLKLGAVTWCEYDPAQNKALPPDVDPDPSIEVRAGDLLFARKNTYELVAACALVRSTPPRLMMSDLIFRLRLRPDCAVDPVFLHRLLIHPSKRAQVQKLAGGSAGSMPNISKSRLAKLSIEIPPIASQRKFAVHAEKIQLLNDVANRAFFTSDALFATLQQRAFAGEL